MRPKLDKKDRTKEQFEIYSKIANEEVISWFVASPLVDFEKTEN